jgi:hypothetical protein
MSHRSPSRSLLVLVGLFVLAGSVPGQAAELSRLYIRGPAAPDVTQAFDMAARKLEELACQELFADFTDAEGRTLLENLGGQDPVEYLAQMIIRDGEIPKGSGRCAVPGAAAFTAGGAVVFICGPQFQAERPSRRATALIHEMLHTVGLRENLPGGVRDRRPGRAPLRAVSGRVYSSNSDATGISKPGKTSSPVNCAVPPTSRTSVGER